MNSLIVFACVLAAAVAAPEGYSVKVHHPHGHSSISSGLHHGGYSHGGYSHGGYEHGVYAHGDYSHAGYAHATYPSQHRQVDPVAIAAGAPLPHGDAPDVAAAKSAHLHAHAAATARHHAAAAAAPPSAEDHHYNSHETHAVHPVAYNSYSHGNHAAYPVAYHGYGHSEARLVDPVAIAAGAPLPVGDTAEVAHAKALHFKAHAARGNLIRHRRGVHAVAYNAPLVHDDHHAHGYNAPLFKPAYHGGYAKSHTSVTIGGHSYHY